MNQNSQNNLQAKDFELTVVFFENKNGGTCSGFLENNIIKTISHCFDPNTVLNFENVIIINKSEVNILSQKKVRKMLEKNL